MILNKQTLDENQQHNNPTNYEKIKELSDNIDQIQKNNSVSVRKENEPTIHDLVSRQVPRFHSDRIKKRPGSKVIANYDEFYEKYDAALWKKSQEQTYNPFEINNSDETNESNYKELIRIIENDKVQNENLKNFKKHSKDIYNRIKNKIFAETIRIMKDDANKDEDNDALSFKTNNTKLSPLLATGDKNIDQLIKLSGISGYAVEQASPEQRESLYAANALSAIEDPITDGVRKINLYSKFYLDKEELLRAKIRNENKAAEKEESIKKPETVKTEPAPVKKEMPKFESLRDQINSIENKNKIPVKQEPKKVEPVKKPKPMVSMINIQQPDLVSLKDILGNKKPKSKITNPLFDDAPAVQHNDPEHVISLKEAQESSYKVAFELADNYQLEDDNTIKPISLKQAMNSAVDELVSDYDAAALNKRK